jgi:two-component system, OmpR family, sensor kinase
MSRALAPLLAAAIALAGSLASTLYLFGAAQHALDHVLEERLRGAGESTALLLAEGGARADFPRLMSVNALDGASLVDRSLTLIADAGGRAGSKADLLRIDADHVARAFQGQSFVGPGYALGGVTISSGYFPVRGAQGDVEAVLVLEAGQSFLAARGDLSRARSAAVLLSIAAALGLGFIAWRWNQAERRRQKAAEQAARGQSITRMAAMVAHEIRNPLGIIRGTVELMRERAGGKLPRWQHEALDDLLGEVERMRRLTEDFLALGTPRHSIALAPVDLAEVLINAARGCEAAHRDVRVRCRFGELPAVAGDPGRLGQVFANLLANASQAIGSGELEVSAAVSDGLVSVQVHDDGPGLPAAVRERLFDPFVTTKPGGTGLGLTISKMLVEQHGGTLALVADGRAGTTFEVRLSVFAAEGDQHGPDPGRR